VTDAEIREAVEQALHRVAPEADLRAIAGSADLREEIDLDSMDVLNFFVALHDKLNVDIAESEYGRMTTMDGCVTTLRAKLAAASSTGVKTRPSPAATD
jgi:acyl carrier protein